MDNQLVQASIITIGDELMIGQVVDTNSTWIAQQLNLLGIWLRKRVAVGDNFNEIWKALDEESVHSNIILITGGLGPTADDITKPLLCKYFNSTLVTDENVLRHVQHLFENVLKRPFTELNRRQAEVPEACTVIHNARGTAPGMLFERNNVIYISMPGVPHEMKGMMTDIVLPMLKERFTGGHILHRTLVTAGIGESFLAEHINNWEIQLPSHIKIAYLPGAGLIRLRLTATGSDEDRLQNELELHFAQLKSIVQEWLIAEEDMTISQLVGQMLKARNSTLGTAESCTGGYIAHLVTSEPGSSAYYVGSVVSYANQIKKDVLGVKEETLIRYGAVSEETVREMAKGAFETLKADFVIATSGIMGPDGGTPDKPVGTVWIAAGSRENIIARKFHFRYDRMRNIELAATQALNMLRKVISDALP